MNKGVGGGVVVGLRGGMLVATRHITERGEFEVK